MSLWSGSSAAVDLSGDLVALHLDLGNAHQRAGVLLDFLMRVAVAVFIDRRLIFPRAERDHLSGVVFVAQELLVLPARRFDHERRAFLLPHPLRLGDLILRN